MHFDARNKVVQLCARGMELGATQLEEAKALFMEAWNASTNNLEKCIAAQYGARHQSSAEEKLHWDKTALEFALKTNDNHINYIILLYISILQNAMRI